MELTRWRPHVFFYFFNLWKQYNAWLVCIHILIPFKSMWCTISFIKCPDGFSGASFVYVCFVTVVYLSLRLNLLPGKKIYKLFKRILLNFHLRYIAKLNIKQSRKFGSLEIYYIYKTTTTTTTKKKRNIIHHI